MSGEKGADGFSHSSSTGLIHTGKTHTSLLVVHKTRVLLHTHTRTHIYIHRTKQTLLMALFLLISWTAKEVS